MPGRMVASLTVPKPASRARAAQQMHALMACPLYRRRQRTHRLPRRTPLRRPPAPQRGCPCPCPSSSSPVGVAGTQAANRLSPNLPDQTCAPSACPLARPQWPVPATAAAAHHQMEGAQRSAPLAFLGNDASASRSPLLLFFLPSGMPCMHQRALVCHPTGNTDRLQPTWRALSA